MDCYPREEYYWKKIETSNVSDIMARQYCSLYTKNPPSSVII